MYLAWKGKMGTSSADRETVSKRERERKRDIEQDLAGSGFGGGRQTSGRSGHSRGQGPRRRRRACPPSPKSHPATRWSTTLSSNVNLPYAMNFRGLMWCRFCASRVSQTCPTRWSTRVSGGRHFSRNVTKFAPHKALKLIA